MKYEQRKFYSGREVLYIVGLVFLTCMIVSGIGFYFVGHRTAIVSLDVSGIGISIVLAVIAIVWTMVDSGGQKESIYRLQMTVDSLQDSLSSIKELIDTTRDLASQFDEMLRSNEMWKEVVQGDIRRLTEVSRQKGVDSDLVQQMEAIGHTVRINSNIVARRKQTMVSHVTLTFDILFASYDDRSRLSDDVVMAFQNVGKVPQVLVTDSEGPNGTTTLNLQISQTPESTIERVLTHLGKEYRLLRSSWSGMSN